VIDMQNWTDVSATAPRETLLAELRQALNFIPTICLLGNYEDIAWARRGQYGEEAIPILAIKICRRAASMA
jgi:hypothetical protein